MPVDLVQRLRLRAPIIQAPLSGAGPTNPGFLAAVANAGALSFLGAAYLSPQQIDERLVAVRRLLAVQRPSVGSIGVNLFLPAPVPAVTQAQLERARAAVAPHHARLGLPPPTLAQPVTPDFDAQLDVVLRHRPDVVSFTFGAPPRALVDRCRAAGPLVVGTATDVDEGRALAAAGVDAIVAQGAEAGGHRGTFAARPHADACAPTLALTAAMVAAVPVPVIAAGGIGDGAGIAAALRHGASAAQLGTAFLGCTEAEISEPYRRALFDRSRRGPTWIRCFSGRTARGLPNGFTDAYPADEGAILPYPLQNALTRDLRRRAAEVGDPECLALWAGTGVARIEAVPVAVLIERLMRELG